MGAMNRQQRRKAEREQVREWRRQGQMNQVLSLQRNGITCADLDKAREDGYRDGIFRSSEDLLKKLYSAIAKELIAHDENTKEEIVEFVKAVDHRFSLMYDADQEIEDVYNILGVYFDISRNALESRIKEE